MIMDVTQFLVMMITLWAILIFLAKANDKLIDILEELRKKK